MYCPSCENMMPDDSKHCSRCGMFLNKTSEKFVHLSLDFAWIWRRSWAGFASGFIGWIIVFIISRMVSNDVGPVLNNLFSGMICGVFLGTVGGIIEESSYKAFYGGMLGTLGGAIGGLINIPLMEMLEAGSAWFPFTVLITWAIGGAFIGATSGLIEKSGKKVIAGAVFGLVGGAIGGYLGSVFYGSVLLDFKPQGWLANRLAEGLSGGLVGAVLWFSIGIIEKMYIFHRREDPKIEKKTCDHCGKDNPLRSWYCGECGHSLPTAAPRQKIIVTPYRGIERITNALRFLSWLFAVTGVITTPVIFFIFLTQNIVLACISAVFAVLFTYLMVVGFRFAADMLLSLSKLASISQTQIK